MEGQSGGGQDATWLRLMDQYRPALWRLVHSYEADSGRREDLFQEIALALWRAVPRFRGESSERTWLYRIAHNIAISALVSRRRQEGREVALAESPEPPCGASNADARLILDEQRETMMAAIRQLPAVDRQLMVLHLEGLSYEEMEQISGLSESAIATRLSRIRSRVAANIRKEQTK